MLFSIAGNAQRYVPGSYFFKDGPGKSFFSFGPLRTGCRQLRVFNIPYQVPIPVKTGRHPFLQKSIQL